MRDNVGIAELSSPMLRDLLRETCAGVGRVALYASVDDARAAFVRNPPKIMIIGGAPLDTGLLALLKRVVTTHGVIGLAVADAHDLQLAMQAGALDGFARTPEGLRQLALRLRPLLAPSLRPSAAQPVRLQISRPPHTPVPTSVRTHGMDKTNVASSNELHATARCALIALASFAVRGDAIAYLLSRLPNTLPGIALVHGHIQPTAELTRLLAEESTWRIHEAGQPGLITPGSVWIAQRNAGWQVHAVPEGFELRRTTTASAGGPSHIAGIDTFFESVASALGRHALGVLLGATGDEGSHGLWALRSAGSYTLAQSDLSAGTSEGRSHNTKPPTVAHEVLGLDRLPQAMTAYCAGYNHYGSLRP